MRRIHPVLPFGLVLLLAACQTVQPTQPPSASASPTAVPGASQQPVPGATVAPSAAPTPAPARVQVSGKVYDDQGRALPNARIEVSSSDNSLNLALNAIGGAYAIPDVAVGTRLTVRAMADGYTTRERVHEATPLRPDEDLDPNELDFGGPGRGAYYALSQFPEIIGVTPNNQQTGVSANPLVVNFRLSHPLSAAEQGRFGKLLQIRFQVPTEVSASGELILRPGIAYDDEAATLTWNEAGTEGTFRFGAPIVTGGAEASSVTIGFDQSAAVDAWPEATNGKTLGRDRVFETYAGNGTTVSGQIAPFWRGASGLVAPTDRPSPAAIWGKTHMTTSTFSLAPDTRRPKVKQVTAYRGTGGANDTFVVMFDEPVRGYPESALDGSAIRPSNYRYVLGNTDTADDEKRFKEADPVTGGNTPTLEPYYSRNRNDTVILPLPSGALKDYDLFKLYVTPDVKDVAGNGIETSERDPATGLAIHIIQGTII